MIKLLFQQRFFSWFDSYDIHDENGSAVYTVRGKPAWGHKLEIYDPEERQLATLREQVFTFLPKFDIQIGGETVGTISKELTFLKPSFDIDCNGWRVEGNFWEWDYRILAPDRRVVATLEKQFFNFTDTYTMEIADPKDSLLVLMVALAIDAVKCEQN